MKDLKVGCQTFTWEMLGDRFAGGPDDLAQSDRRWRLCRHRDHRHDDRPLCPQTGGIRDRAKDIRPDAGFLRLGSNSGFTLKEKIGTDLDTAKRWIDSPPPFRARWCRWARRRWCPTVGATTSS